MLDFLRLLTPRHGDALRPASGLQRWATPAFESSAPGIEDDAQVPVPSTPAMRVTAPFPRLVDEDGDVPPPMPIPDRHATPPSAHPQANMSSSDRGPRRPIRIDATPPARAAPPAATPLAHASRNAARPATAPSTREPLSPAFVALHAAPAADVAPAIHVSIDRIEVRAPAVATAPRAPRPRTPPPTQSLADYLRGGKGRSA